MYCFIACRAQLLYCLLASFFIFFISTLTSIEGFRLGKYSDSKCIEKEIIKLRRDDKAVLSFFQQER